MKLIYPTIGILLGIVLLWISPVSPSYFAYVVAGNVVFWSSVLLLSFNFMKQEISLIKGRMSKFVASIFLIYLSIHYFVYSIALEKLLDGIFGVLFQVSSPFITLTYSPFFPPSLLTLLYNTLFNPAIVGGFPPNFYFELSSYAIVMGLVIATLVTANIVRVMQYASYLKRTKVIILAPLLGVIGGGSCCISVPILLAEAIPAANFILFSPLGDTALFLAYVLLPPLTAIGLKLNFDAMRPKAPKNLRINYTELSKKNEKKTS
ncbi:hypothetical protein [Sulfuracidifex tepidarius]|uniref:Uncharacterized protein n=1 Tax=Sulfuracidifex tepidarius TaxID=1294262 RepID=A0A510DX55_9CREN|nr:hypothetical protein [Sulfuracidifex tepidarius]BBG24787.1 hypothetical protein IC006_2121 [Sulfuracidifex tepidarius]BBG27573.1 hypothetical protein IC007_2127 [Sulfuracidifex tepidarius]